MRAWIIFLVSVGVVFLQIFLSKRNSKWLGLILPVIAFGVSLVYLLNIAAPSGDVTADFVLQVVLVFVLTNIPTVLLIGIYCACREKVRRKKEIEKMNIQDLK
jgi:hypothetical protein